MRKLILYSRPECHLCEARGGASSQPLLAGRPVELEIVDVDSSVALERRYGLRIPVLVDGRRRAVGLSRSTRPAFASTSTRSSARRASAALAPACRQRSRPQAPPSIGPL